MTPRDRSAKEQEKAAQKAGDEAAQSVKDETGIGERPPSDPEALREEIQDSREQLGETVEALAGKADVKAQVAEKQEQVKAQVAEKQEQVKAQASDVAGKVTTSPPVQRAKERPAVAAGAALGLLLLIAFLLRRR